MSEEASSSTGGAQARTSGRNKVKSQRAIESEDSARMFAAAKARQKAEAEAEAAAQASGDVKPSSRSQNKSKSQATKGKGKAKSKPKKEEVYCVCKKPTNDDDGPMIECAECNDWFHFSCVDLTEDVAERIHNYVCRDCTEATGNKTTMMYDITTFKSPSPPGGLTTTTKRKTARSKSRQTSDAPGTGSSSSGDSGDEIDNPPESSTSSSESESESEITGANRQAKRPRTSKELPLKPTSASLASAKASVPRPPPRVNRKNTALLPKARLFVIDRLAILIKTIFGDKLDEEGVHRYAKNLEESLFDGFKDGQGSKAVAGGRYKTQFTLLDRALPKARPELLDEITSFSLPAAKVAHLTSADLASAERLEELEKAKKAALEQTVKQKDDIGTIRMGRDGFERVEDARERELVALARQEQAARKEAERRESLGTPADEVSVGELTTGSPLARRESASATPQAPRLDRYPSSSLPQSPVVRRDSVSVDTPKSPVKSNFGLTSAWASGAAAEAGENQPLSLGDQTVLDLSDIVADEPEEEEEESMKMDLDEEDGPAKTEVVKEVAQPVVWNGSIVNPAVEGSKPVPISARVAAKNSFEPQWKTLLPHDVIAISGRVPIPASLKYLSDSRLNPTKDLITTIFAPSEVARDEELRAWTDFIEFHLNKERHAIYHPYGNSPIPYHGARELYLIPMRVADAAPEFTELLDGFSIPTKRETPILLAIFVGDKKHLQVQPPPPPPAPPIVSDTGAGPASSTPPVSLLPNAKLQELMASLNPAALQGVLAGGHSPSASTTAIVTPPQRANDPYPPHQGYQPPYPGSSHHQPPQRHDYHSPYPPNDYPNYNHQNQPYQAGYGGYTADAPPTHGGQGGSRHSNWHSRSTYNGERDNGWSSRGGRRY